MPGLSGVHRRAMYARTNYDGNRGFKDNTPGSWVSTNGPVWWYGNDNAYAMLAPGGSGMSAVTRAINIITEPIAAAEWVVDGETPRWLSDPMLTRPDGRYPVSVWPAHLRVPRMAFWGQWIRNALTYGMGYLIYQETEDYGPPQPGSLFLLPPEQVSPGVMFLDGRIITLAGEQLQADRNGYFVWNAKRWRLLELRNILTPLDPQTGMTPGTIAYHAAEMGLIDSQMVYAAGMYNGGGVPSGYLKIVTPQITQDMASGVQANWEASHATGQRRTAVLGPDVTYTPIAISPVDAALAEMKRLSLVDIANAFCVPGYMLGAPEGSSMTYSNVEMQAQSLFEFTLRPWTVAIEETLSALLPGDTKLNIRPTGEGRATSNVRSAPRPDLGVSPGDVPQG